MTGTMEELQKIISETDNIVFFGGAGVSTESGIPDFRSVDGLYNQKYDYPPETIISHTFYRKKPEEFFRFYKDKIVAVVGGGIGNRKTVFQKLDVQVAVSLRFIRFVPYPNEVSVARGILVPFFVIGFDNDGSGIRQLFPCEGRGLLSVFFYLAGGFGRIDRQVSGFQNAALNHMLGHEEMGGIAVDKGFYRDFLLDGLGGKIQADTPRKITRLPRFRTGGQNARQAENQAKGKDSKKSVHGTIFLTSLQRIRTRRWRLRMQRQPERQRQRCPGW